MKSDRTMRWQDLTPEEVSALPLCPLNEEVYVKDYDENDPIGKYDKDGNIWTIGTAADGSYYRDYRY